MKEIYVPTNGYFTERTVAALCARYLQESRSLKLFGIELSLDGMPEFHDEFRKSKNSFRKAMETYDALVELQKEDAAPADPRDLDGHRDQHGARSAC